MADRHVRGTVRVVGELSAAAKAEFCKNAHLESIRLAQEGMSALRNGDFDTAWSAANEGRAIGAIMGTSCSRVKFRI